MQGSPSIKPFEERAKAWATKLVLIQDLIDIWLKVQGVWQYLEPIFGSEDIMRQMPEEGKLFKKQDVMWRENNKAILKAVIRFMVDGDENEVLDNTWRKLSREMKNKWQLLIGTVWCGGKGQPICEYMGITGTTIAWGDPWDLKPLPERFEGRAGYKYVRALIDEEIQPFCATEHEEWCSDEMLEYKKELEGKSIEELDKMIAFQTTDVQLMSKVYNSEYQGKQSDLLRKEEALGQAYQDLVIPAREQLALMKEILEVRNERSAAI